MSLLGSGNYLNNKRRYEQVDEDGQDDYPPKKQVNYSSENQEEEEESSVDDINLNVMPSTYFRDYSNISFDITEEVYNSPPQSSFNYHFPEPLYEKKNFDCEFFGSTFESVLVEQFPIDEAIKMRPEHKINLVLDIDSTMIYSKELASLNAILENYNDSHKIEINVENFNFKMVFNLRGYLNEFLQRMKKICNFYICTLSKEPYAMEILKIIQDKTGIEIPKENIIAVPEGKDSKTIKKKSLEPCSELIKNDNKIIIDDTVSVWKDDDLKCLLPSKRYCSFNDADSFPYSYNLETNDGTRVQESSQIYYEADELRIIPLHYENDNSPTFQLEYLANFIEKVFKLSINRNVGICYAAKIIRKRVFEGITVDLTYYEDYQHLTLLSSMVCYLGGNLAKEKNNATHFVISPNNVTLFRRPKKVEGKLIHFFAVNSKWLFDCYFNLARMDETHSEYKVVL